MQIQVEEKGNFTVLTIVQESVKKAEMEYFDSYLKNLLEKKQAEYRSQIFRKVSPLQRRHCDSH